MLIGATNRDATITLSSFPWCSPHTHSLFNLINSRWSPPGRQHHACVLGVTGVQDQLIHWGLKGWHWGLPRSGEGATVTLGEEGKMGKNVCVCVTSSTAHSSSHNHLTRDGMSSLPNLPLTRSSARWVPEPQTPALLPPCLWWWRGGSLADRIHDGTYGSVGQRDLIVAALIFIGKGEGTTKELERCILLFIFVEKNCALLYFAENI